MKTGFIQGFVNIMKPKPYPYHGLLNQCGTQPEIPPYLGPDMKPPGEEWVIAWEGSLYSRPNRWIAIYPFDFLNSSDEHPCSDKTYCTKNVYYFAEVYLWQIGIDIEMILYWSNGLGCKIEYIKGNYLYVYKSWFDFRYCGSRILIMVFNTGPSSTGRIWKSLTGNYPGYYPFPQKLIIRV